MLGHRQGGFRVKPGDKINTSHGPRTVMNNDQWPTFGAEYRHPDGGTYSFHFLARDADDARIRLRAIQGNAELIGELKGTIPADIPGAGLWVRFRCWLGNLFR